MSEKLKEIIVKYPQALEDSQKLKAFLKDYFPENRLLQNTLMMVWESGIVTDIKQKSEINKFQMYGYIKCLVNEYGIAEKMAYNAVVQWVTSLEKGYDEIEIQEETNRKPKLEGEVIDYSDYTIDDFEITGKVIRFSGEGQKLIPNVVINEGTYIVKASKCMQVCIYDAFGKDSIIITPLGEKYKEDMFNTGYLNLTKPVIIKVQSNDQWEVEMIPF